MSSGRYIQEREMLLMYLDHATGSKLNIKQVALKYKRGYGSTMRALRKVAQSQELKDKAQALLDSEDILSIPDDVVKVTDLQALQDENAFLLWWNTGERKGWVDRLLKKVQE